MALTPQKPILIELSNFRHDRGHCFAIQRVDLDGGDTQTDPMRSSLLLYEDGTPLGPPHSIHDAIAELGKGQYSHWSDTIYFSASDNSDPRHNGRRYHAGLPVLARKEGQREQKSGQAADPTIDKIFSLPMSASLRQDTGSALACRHALRSMYRRIVLLAPSRSGSEYFSHQLRSLGIDSEEFLTVGSSVSRGRAMPEGADEATFIAKVCDHAPNRIFCTKELVHRLMPLFAIGEFPQHLSEWHFIHLIRRNVVRQAVSLFLAEQTGRWRNDMAATAVLDPKEVTFTAIAKRVNEIFLARQRIDRFLGLFEIKALTIYYEELVAYPAQTMRRVQTFLQLSNSGFSPLPSGTKPAPTAQGADVNAALETSFRAELGRRLEYGQIGFEALLSTAANPDS